MPGFFLRLKRINRDKIYKKYYSLVYKLCKKSIDYIKNE